MKKTYKNLEIKILLTLSVISGKLSSTLTEMSYCFYEQTVTKSKETMMWFISVTQLLRYKDKANKIHIIVTRSKINIEVFLKK